MAMLKNTNFELRDYQVDCLNAVGKFLNSNRYTSGLLSIATGMGKTVIGAELIKRYFNPKDHRTIMVAGLNETLIYQNEDTLKFVLGSAKIKVHGENKLLSSYFPTVGVVQGGKREEYSARVISASAQSIISKDSAYKDVDISREKPIQEDDFVFNSWGGVELSTSAKKRGRKFLISDRIDKILAYGLISLWLHDEAHHSVSDGSLIALYRLKQLYKFLDKKLYIIGLTATPVRNDDRSLISLYETVIFSRDLLWGQENGYLAPFGEIYSIRLVNDEGDGIDDGMLVIEDVSVDKADNWADMVVETYSEYTPDTQAVAYVGKIVEKGALEASKLLAKKFNAAGIPAIHIDGTNIIDEHGAVHPTSERDRFFDRYRKREIRVICNYGVMVEGVDIANIETIILLRRTTETTITQIIGRAVRLDKDNPNKKVRILNFVGMPLSIVADANFDGYKIDPFNKTVKESYLDELDDVTKDFVYNSVMAKSFVIDILNTLRLQKSYGKRIPENSEEYIKRIVKIYNAKQVNRLTYDDFRIMRRVNKAYSTYLNGDLPLFSMEAQDKVSVSGVIVELSEIRRSTIFDWYVHRQGSMSLSIGERDMLYILPPDFDILSKITFDTIKNAFKVEDKLAQHIYNILSEYTVWHLRKNHYSWEVKNNTYLAFADTPVEATRNAESYIRANLSDEMVFGKRKSSWKYSPATDSQLQFLSKLLGGMDVPKDLTKGKAASLISHLLGEKAVLKFKDGIVNRLKDFVQNV